MKKKLALIVSIVLVLAAVVCLFAFPASAADEFVDANTTAKALWNAVPAGKTATAFSLTSDSAADITAASGDLSAIKTEWTGTYTFADGILTLKGNGNTISGVTICADGALWIVLDNINIDGAIHHHSLLHKDESLPNDQEAPDDDLPLIISSPIDANLNLVANGIGGMIYNAGSNGIRSNGSMVVMGDVGFELAKDATGDNSDVFCIARNNPNYVKTVVIANGRESVIGGPNNKAFAALNSHHGCRLIFDNTAKLTVNGSINNGTADSNVTEFQNNANVVLNSGVVSKFGTLLLEDNAKLTVRNISTHVSDKQISVGAAGTAGKFTIDDNAVLDMARTGNLANWTSCIAIYGSVDMLGGKINLDLDSSATSNVDAVSAFSVEYGNVNFAGGVMNISINAPKNTRVHGLFLKSLVKGEDTISLGGTTFNVDMVSRNANGTAGVFTLQDVSADVNMTAGVINVNAPTIKSIFCMRGASAFNVNVLGGSINGTAMNLVSMHDKAHAFKIGPDAKLTVETVESVIANASSGTTSDTGVTYHNGASLTANGKSIVTANAVAAKATIVKITDNAGVIHNLDLTNNVYPASATPADAQAYLSEAGKLVINNLVADKIEAYGSLAIEVKGNGSKLGESYANGNDNGIRVNGALSLTGAAGSKLTILTYTKALYNTYGDMVINGDVTLDIDANNEVVYTETTAGAMIIEGNAKLDVFSAWRMAIKVRGANAAGEGLLIRGNADIDIVNNGNYGIQIAGPGDLKMTSGTLNIGGNGYEAITAKVGADQCDANKTGLYFLGGSVTIDSTGSGTNKQWSFISSTTGGEVVFENVTVNLGTVQKVDNYINGAINVGSGTTVEFRSGAKVTAYAFRSTLLTQKGGGMYFYDGCDVKAYGKYQTMYVQSGASEFVVYGGNVLVEATNCSSYGYGAVHNGGTKGFQFLGGNITVNSNTTGLYAYDNLAASDAVFTIGSTSRTTNLTVNAGQLMRIRGGHPNVQIIGKNTTVDYNARSGEDAILFEMNGDLDTSTTTNVQYNTLNIDGATLIIDENNYNGTTYNANAAIRLAHGGTANAKFNAVPYHNLTIKDAKVTLIGRGQVLLTNHYDVTSSGSVKSTIAITGASDVDITNVGVYHGIEMRSGQMGEFLISGTSTVDVNTGVRQDAQRHAVEMNANLTVSDNASLTVNGNLAKSGETPQHALYVKGTMKVTDTASVKSTQSNAAGGRAIHAEKGVFVNIASNNGSKVNLLASTVATTNGHTYALISNGDITIKGAAKAQISSVGIAVSTAGNFLAEGNPNIEIDSRNTAINAPVDGKTIKFLGGYAKIDNNISGANTNTLVTKDGDIVFDAKVDINTELGASTQSKWVISAGLSGDIVFEDDADVQVFGLNSTVFKGNTNAVTGNIIFNDGCEVDIYSQSSQGIRIQQGVGDIIFNDGCYVTINSHSDAIKTDGTTPGDVIVNGGTIEITARSGRAVRLEGSSLFEMNDGVFSILSGPGTGIDLGETASADIYGGTLNVTVVGIGISSAAGDVYIADAEVNITNGKTGISARNLYIVDNAYVNIDNTLDTTTWSYGINCSNLYVDGNDTVIDIAMTGNSAQPTVGIAVSDQEAYYMDGTVNILIDNANNKSSNRNHALFFKTKKAIELAGTDFNVVMNLKIADTYLAGMITTQDITTPINISGGNLDFRGDKYVNTFIKARANGEPINITGGTITGSAKYFWDTQSSVDSNKAKTSFYDQVLTIDPAAKIDFFNFSGDTHYIGQFNADNQTYYNSYDDEGVEYLYGCAFKDNDYFLTTANTAVAGAVTQLALVTNDGANENLYLNPAQTANRIFYGDNGDPAIILNAGGNVSVIDSVDVAWMNGNGDMIVDVQGENVFINKTGNNAISTEGSLTLKGNGSLELSGKQYVLYSNSDITIRDQVKLDLVSTNGCGIHVGRMDPACFIHITDDAEVTVSSSGTSGRAIYAPGINATVTIDGNAKVDLTAQVAGIYALNDTPNASSGSSTINVGGNAQVAIDAQYGLFTNGGVSTVNIYENAIVDIPAPAQGIRAVGVDCSVNLSGNADVVIDTPTSDGIHIQSNVLGAKGMDQNAELNVADNASLVMIDAGSCGARILISTDLKDENGDAVPGTATFTATDNATVDLSSAGQTVYLNAAAVGSKATFAMTDAANVNLTNNHPTGQYGSALTVYSPDNDVDITSTGTLNVVGKAASWTAAFYVKSAADGKTDVLIKDTTVNVKNISACTITTEEVKNFAGEVSNAMDIEGNGTFEITGKAVLNAYAEKNGKELKNRAHGLFIHDGMTMKVSGRAKATFTGAGNSEASTGAGIHSKGADIIVTDRAQLKAFAKGNAVAGITFEGTSSLTANGYGWANVKAYNKEGCGIRVYNNSAKAKVTVEDGGLVTLTGTPAYKKSGTRITISATGALAGEDKASAVETDPAKLTGKEGYIRLNGVNPNTSDFTVTFIAVAAVVLAVVAAGVVIFIRKRKAQED